MAFVNLFVFTIIVSVIIFESDCGPDRSTQKHDEKYYNSSQFVGKWYIIGASGRNSSQDNLKCAYMNVQSARNNMFRCKIIALINSERLEIRSALHIADNKITGVFVHLPNEYITYTILNYENPDEIVLRTDIGDAYLLISRTRDISKALWMKYDELAKGMGQRLLYITHDHCA